MSAEEVIRVNGFALQGICCACKHLDWLVVIMQEIVPKDVKEVTHAFESIGHIAHLNLRDDLLPYRHLIGQVNTWAACKHCLQMDCDWLRADVCKRLGSKASEPCYWSQVLLDKNPAIKTVVNKVRRHTAEVRSWSLTSCEHQYVFASPGNAHALNVVSGMPGWQHWQWVQSVSNGRSGWESQPGNRSQAAQCKIQTGLLPGTLSAGSFVREPLTCKHWAWDTQSFVRWLV